MLKVLNYFRIKTKIWNLQQIQRYADDQFYAFTRGDYFFAFTNQDYNFSRTITYHPYTNGISICNIFDKNDRITVNNNQFNISMGGGNFKIYEKCENSKFNLSESYQKVKELFKKYFNLN